MRDKTIDELRAENDERIDNSKLQVGANLLRMMAYGNDAASKLVEDSIADVTKKE